MTDLPYQYPTNISNVTGFVTWANDASSGILGMGMPVVIFIIVFMSLKLYGNEDAAITASFISAISSYMLFVLGLVNGFIPILFTLLLALLFFVGKSNLFKGGDTY